MFGCRRTAFPASSEGCKVGMQSMLHLARHLLIILFYSPASTVPPSYFALR
jgi:hypothetical protein